MTSKRVDYSPITVESLKHILEQEGASLVVSKFITAAQHLSAEAKGAGHKSKAEYFRNTDIVLRQVINELSTLIR